MSRSFIVSILDDSEKEVVCVYMLDLYIINIKAKVIRGKSILHGN